MIGERGAVETNWLIGMNVKINKRYGRITKIKEWDAQNKASILEIKFKSNSKCCTYNEVMDIIFSSWRVDEEMTNEKLETEIQSSTPQRAKSTIKCRSTVKTSIHTSLSNTLWRALNSSDPYNGYQMISHFIQARNIENRSLAKKIRTLFFEKQGWNIVTLLEFSKRCSDGYGLDVEKYVDWGMIEKYLSESSASCNSGSLNLTKVSFMLEYLSQIFEKLIDDDISCESFFGPKDNIHNAFKELTHYTAIYWSHYYNIILGKKRKDVDPNIAIRVRRCVEAFGKACVNLSSIYIKVNQVNEMGCAFIIKDSLFNQLQDCELSLKELKQLKLLFVLTLDDELLQKHLSEMFEIPFECYAFNL